MKFGQMDLKTKIKHHRSIKKEEKNLKALGNELAFYDFKTLSPNNDYQFIVQFTDNIEVTTYSDIEYSGNEFDFTYQMETLKCFINQLFKYLPEDYCLIRNYGTDWIVDKELSLELYEHFNEQGILNNSKQLLSIKKDDRLISLLLDSIFQYNSFVQFIFKESGVIVSPSDHLDLFISGNKLSEVRDILNNCLNNFSKREVLEIRKIFNSPN